MSLEKEIQKLTDAVVALTVVMREAHKAEWLTSPPGTPAPESVREYGASVPEGVITYATDTSETGDEPEEEIEAAPAPEPEAPPAPPPTLDQVKAAFRALAGRVGNVARNQALTAELLRAHGGGESPHLKHVKAEDYAALIAAVESAS